MAKPKTDPKPEMWGVGVLKAPGGGLVIVSGPIDLSRAEALSPAWTREIRETRPRPVTSEPDNQGNVVTAVLPMLVTIGSERIHGESVRPSAERLNKQAGILLNRALLGKDVAPLELLEAMQRTEKPKRQHRQETAYDKWLRAERALDMLGKPDAIAIRTLRAAGRTDAQVTEYMKTRGVFIQTHARGRTTSDVVNG